MYWLQNLSLPYLFRNKVLFLTFVICIFLVSKFLLLRKMVVNKFTNKIVYEAITYWEGESAGKLYI